MSSNKIQHLLTRIRELWIPYPQCERKIHKFIIIPNFWMPQIGIKKFFYNFLYDLMFDSNVIFQPTFVPNQIQSESREMKFKIISSHDRNSFHLKFNVSRLSDKIVKKFVLLSPTDFLFITV